MNYWWVLLSCYCVRLFAGLVDFVLVPTGLGLLAFECLWLPPSGFLALHVLFVCILLFEL